MDSALLPRLLPCNAFGKQRLSFKTKGLIMQVQEPKDQMYRAKCNSCPEKPIRVHHLRFSNSMTQLQDSRESIFERRKFKTYLNATLDHESGSEPKLVHLKEFSISVWEKLRTLYRFCRFYAVMGTIIGVMSDSLVPVESMADLTPSFLVGLLKINKPYLPLASEELSMEAGIAITVSLACLSITMALMFRSPPLLYGILLQFLLGSAYSVNLPCLRWKLSSFLAPFYIMSVRAIIVPVSIYAHMQTLGRPFVITRSLVFRVATFLIITLVISLFKDIPDVEGGDTFGFKSLSVRLGKKRVFSVCISLLLTGYLAAMVVGSSSSSMINKLITVVGHGTLALIAWQRSQYVDLESQDKIRSYYMLIWKGRISDNIVSNTMC